VAAHILPASPGGPRGGKLFRERQLKAPENAIWVCADHARNIDANRGAKYPSALLLSYKALQEAKIAREQRGIVTPMGWFHTFTLEDSPIFAPDSKLMFGKLTIIVGANSTGKTALSEWLVGMSDPSVLGFWLHSKKAGFKLRMRLDYFNPGEQTLKLELDPNQVPQYYLNGKVFPFNPSPIRFIIVREPGRLKLNLCDLDDLQLICSELNIDAVTAQALLQRIEAHGSGTIRNIRLQEEGRLTLRADFEKSEPGIEFRQWGHSQQTRLLIEIAITAGRCSAQHVPTMVVIEGAWRLDEFWFKRYCDYLATAENLFQTVMLLPQVRYRISDLLSSGWSFAHLIGRKGGTTIEQR